MGVEFEWRVSSQDGQWEVLAENRRRRRPRCPWWAWLILALVVGSASVGAYLWLRARYETAVQTAEFQIQAVIDLEARAMARGDPSLFLEQQDRSAAEWYRQQVLRAQPDCLERLDALEALRAFCAPVLPAEIAAIDLRRDLAWLEVIEGSPPLRRARFYRRTEAGWKHTAPPSAFWDDNEQVTFGTTTVFYNRRDLPHLRPVLVAIADASTDVCAAVYCPIVSRLSVRYSPDTPRLLQPYLESDAVHYGSDTLTISSPWLAGIPVDGAIDREETIYWVTYALASRAIRAVNGRALSPLQSAAVIEYAHWRASGDDKEAPLLSHALSARGKDTLPALFRDIREQDSLDHVVRFWLDVSSDSQPERYFEALLGIERDALLAGRLETYLLLQDDRQPWWVEQQLVRFERLQAPDSAPGLPPVQVRSVSLYDGRARVLLEAGSVSERHLPSHVYFVRRRAEWLHTSQVFGD
ncbi:MAG: hypothetical protein JXA09_14500 [Anaerolineae bacterium]|nr:hypothetical protein [Anaerolineae bacterium]